MLIGMGNNSVLKSLEDSEYKFYLTGSRFFGNATVSSDTDFFTSPDPGLDPFLHKLGFHRVSNTYRDKLTLVVYRNLNAGIDIQICKDVEMKQTIQRKFQQMGIVSPTRFQWDFAIHILSPILIQTDFAQAERRTMG